MAYHRILRLPPHVVDPIQIISAAYVQLRRLRTSDPIASAMERQRQVRLIVVARDMLLRRVIDGRGSTRRSRAMVGRLAIERVDRVQSELFSLAASASDRHETILEDGFN